MKEKESKRSGCKSWI